jgi:uncharacterized glyoxalase superfamily protein PhnB
MTEVIPYLFYHDVPAALAFLSRAFGFVEGARHETPRGGMHADMSLDGRRIMMGNGGDEWHYHSPREAQVATMGVFVYLRDVQAHYERAKAAGAEIEQEPADHGYGRTYTARDPEGHPWFFTEAPA